MPITATERAEAMALQVLISARLHHGGVVTHGLVDAVMSRDAGQEQGKANKATVRRIIRTRADSENVRVIFTADERYWAIREQLHHMTGEQVDALSDDIANGGDDDPRGWDRPLINAIAARRSTRAAASRLRGCTPVAVPLWREPLRNLPTPDDVRDVLHEVHQGGHRVHAGIPADHVRTVVSNLRVKQKPFTQGPDGTIHVEDRAYVPLRRFHMRIVNGGTPERVETRAALDEINNAMMVPGKQAVREMSAAGSRARIVYKGIRGTVLLRPATAEEAAATVKPEAERYTAGDQVTVRPVVYNPERREHRVLAEYTGTVVNWHGGHYNVRAVVADEHGVGGVRQCQVHELRPAGPCPATEH
ncbi:hypothetical protein ACGFYQ_33780 [Streptomyces sp. NPDC048258]|uniref:hypothetical protein n=1 Tax=Streptomyces sp. NPDC048258 TaxID=3365527 RepID=UPI003719BD6E